jgi:RNA polymerase sporulation-specific sigma factor
LQGKLITCLPAHREAIKNAGNSPCNQFAGQIDYLLARHREAIENEGNSPCNQFAGQIEYKYFEEEQVQRESEYQNQTDEMLIEALRNGRPDITDYIMEKYKYLVRRRANAMFLIGGDTDDLIQEGMIGLFKAIRDYRREKDASFFHFADLCITRQIYHAVEASQRKKHQPLNGYISLSASVGEEGTDTFLDLLETFENANPEQLLIDRENVRTIHEKMAQSLSALERQVLELYLEGMNYRQIAENLEKEPKAIDNALQRIRGKFAKIL